MKYIFMLIVALGSLFGADTYEKYDTKLPDMVMPDNNLSFAEIQDYQNYKIVATHFRNDKNELRYILANPIGYNALKNKLKVMPEGSKFVKIGWSVKEMTLFPSALEADKIQRVEYMVKDSKKFNHDGDNWGYARFVKSGEKYTPWMHGTQSCISCHIAAKDTDYLFTDLQSTF
ncbi:MAG: cytochrome P460 family protein [Campylobacterales bacterium]|nr:cytochrome P460 family protein [Campylobacterales bacterium]